MSSFLPTIIWRHKKENLKKCSLRGLEKHSELIFLSYPKDPLPSLKNYLLLTIDKNENLPVLSSKDQNQGLFLIDATWRYAAVMEKKLSSPISFSTSNSTSISKAFLAQNLQKRSLPAYFKTAYPRKQTGCSDPQRGLASIEALFLAHLILNRKNDGLLDHYYWKENFLKLNSRLL